MAIIREVFRFIKARTFGSMGQYNAAFAPVLADGESCILQLNNLGHLLITAAPGAVFVVGGPAAQDAPVSGNPVEISFEANQYAIGIPFAPNVPVSADGDVVRPRASRYGVQYGMLVSQNGEHTVQIFGGQANPDPEPTYGIPPMAIRRDNPNPPLENDDTFIPLTTDEHGALWVALDPYVDPMNSTDGAYVAGDRGVLIHAVRKDVPVSLAGSDGDYVPLEQDSDGHMYTHDKALDTGANANRNLPVTDLSAHRIGPSALLGANLIITVATQDLGPEFASVGMTRVRLNLSWLKGDGVTTDIKVRLMVKDTDAGAVEYPIPVYKVNTAAVPYVVTCDDEWVHPCAADGTGTRTLEWELGNTVVACQFQVAADAVGAGPTMAIVAAGTNYLLAWGS